MEEKVSVIIPIYKVEKYLQNCVDSVINQTYSNLEIILVNDGSPDNCGNICDEYAKKDTRIKVIHKENGGLSSARNSGLEVATGEWITFVDSDDYLKQDFIECLTSLSEHNYDVGICLPQVFYDNKVAKDYRLLNTKKIVMNGIEALEIMLYQKQFDTSAWGKIYKRDLWKDIRFPVGKLYEDISTIYKVLLKSENIIYTNEKKYMYLQRKDSIMGRRFKVKDMDYIYECKKMMDEVEKFNIRNLTLASRCRYVNANFSILLKIGNKKEFINERKEILDNISIFRNEVLMNSNSRLKTKIAIIMTYFNLI